MYKCFVFAMIIMRPTIINSMRYAALSRALAVAPDLSPNIQRFASTEDWRKMVDPRRVVSYEDMLQVINQPEKMIIDVRNYDEVNLTGKIPSSINIPLNTVQDALASMSNEEFKNHYHRNKPTSADELIFYCQSGRRSTEALDKALKLGYSNSKTYLGSWNDWSSRQQ